MNRLLREQLDEATTANQSLVAELAALRQDYKEKELERRKEEQVSLPYCLYVIYIILCSFCPSVHLFLSIICSQCYQPALSASLGSRDLMGSWAS